MIITTILFSILSAILYRLGGMSKTEATKRAPWKWFPEWAVNTKARDVGCAFLGYLWMGLFFPDVSWWVHLLSFFGLFGALCTYWDDMFNGKDNFYMHGLMCGLAYLPYAFAGHVGIAFVTRALLMGLFMGVWCEIFSDDYVEECGRGSIIIATLPLMLI